VKKQSPKKQKKEAEEKQEDESEEKKIEGSEEASEKQEDIYIPQAEYTAVCNADFLPMICNDFITEFLEKEHGACTLEKGEAIDLVRNFNFWIAENNLTCARICMYP
jgi:hypothetical protein